MTRSIEGFLLLLLLPSLLLADQRRLGKRHDSTWSSYYDLGKNSAPYLPSEQYPDFSVVGALISNTGALGTATLVAPNYIVTAAHVVKNDYHEIPDPNDWKFYLHDDFEEASFSQVYQIEEIIVHPAWTARQTSYNVLGDGDELGLDLAVAKLNRSVTSLYPARLPSASDDPLGLRTVLGGFGSLVEGNTGMENDSNKQRVGGENIIDRSVAMVSKPGVPESQRGGVLGIDFDSPMEEHNELVSGRSVELLGLGNSEATPLSLEASTAVGDSGGPAFVRTNGFWRVHGVVSYGTTDSSYGDVTVYTRLATHYDWLMNELPDWPDSKILDNSGWLQNPWMGTFIPISGAWIFHVNLGWLYIPFPKGNSFWAWSDLVQEWVWLSDQAFPFIYCYKPAETFWMYVLLDSSDGQSIRAYNYSSTAWGSYGG